MTHPSSKLMNKNNPGWRETCIGVWSRSGTFVKGGSSKPGNSVLLQNKKSVEMSNHICYGILLVTLKKIQKESVPTSNSVGLMVVRTDFRDDDTESIHEILQESYEDASSIYEDAKASMRNYVFSNPNARQFRKTVMRQLDDFRNWLESYWK